MTRKTGNKPKNIRRNNLQLIIDLYRKNGPLSVSDISGEIKLSRTTVTKINEKLLSANLIMSCGKGDSTDEGGKKPELFSFNNDFGYMICFHIFEEFINVKIFNMSLELVQKEKIATRENESLENIIEIIAESVKQNIPRYTADKSRILGIAAAIHGIVDSENGVCYTAPHFRSWGNNRNVKKMLIEKIGTDIPLHIDSWIRFKAYSAKESMISKTYRDYILLDAGYHGIVSGVVINGSLHTGRHYLAGEIGHTIVSASEKKQCYCGGKGCLETFTDCRSLIKKAVSLKKEYPDSLIFSGKNKPDIFDIFEASNKNDKLACMLMDEIAEWFAIGLSNISLMFDPEVIYFEGDYSVAGDYFREKVKKKVHAISLVRLDKDIQIIFNSPEHNTTLHGAAAFARDDYFLNKLDIN